LRRFGQWYPSGTALGWFHGRRTRRPGAFVGHLEEQETSELLDIVAVAHPVVPEDMAVVPEFADNRGWGHGGALFPLEEAWRTLKSGLKLRPVFHWAPHRIHAHVALTVLSLLSERVAEHSCQDTWRNIRDDLKQIKLAQLSSPHGDVWQVTEPRQNARNRRKLLKIKSPHEVLQTT
jgi:hypothetical protein